MTGQHADPAAPRDAARFLPQADGWQAPPSPPGSGRGGYWAPQRPWPHQPPLTPPPPAAARPAPRGSGAGQAAGEPPASALHRRRAGPGAPRPQDGPAPLPAARRGRRQAPEHDPGIAALAVRGNLLVTRDTVTAWFVLPPEAWSFRPATERAAKITAHAARLAQLVGRRAFLRVTTRPFPVRDWAMALDESVRGRHPVMPGPCPRHPHRSEPGCPGCVPGHAWLDWLRDQQWRVHRWGTDDKVVYLGVELESRRGARRALARAAGRSGSAAGLAAGLAQVTGAVAGAGLRGTPAAPEEMRWLLARSCGLLMPPPRLVGERPAPVPYSLPGAAAAEMDRAALAQFTEGYARTARPFGRTVQVTRSDGLTRHVAVLAVASGWAGEDLPGESPWLQRTDLLPFPAEWAVTIDVLDRRRVAGDMHRRISEIRHQAAHYDEHGIPMPPAMSRQFDAARRLEDEQQHSPEAMAGRVLVWARVAVAGDTEAEAVARAGQVAELYSPAIPIAHPPDQLRLSREFIPGEPLSSTAHCRRMPARLLAAGMPAATARIGRRDGFPVGRTASLSARAVTLHPWRDMEERDRSGLIVVTGTLGSGKSTFGGLMAYQAVRAGIATVIMDPSGLLDQLCAVPEIAAHSRAVNLLQSPPGTLSPYALIADPRPEDYGHDAAGRPLPPGQARGAWQQARDAAAVQRRQLAREVLRMLLPAEMRGKEATVALSKAVATAGASPDASLRDVLDAMRAIPDDYGIGRNGLWLADQLEELAGHPWARLFFPPPDGAAAPGDVTSAGQLLTVMTLRGLVVPEPGLPPELHTADQRLSVPLIHLAAWLTRRHVLDRPRHVRKLTILDESHQVTRGAVGQALVEETARDSRKHNHCAIFMSQLPQDLQIGKVGNLIGMALAGRTDGAEEQAATLGFLGLPPCLGHEAALSRLSRDSPGQFMISDGAGVEVVQIDLDGCSAALRRALDSTPTGRHPPAPVPARDRRPAP